MRAFSDINQTSKFRRKLSTWPTARGGFGGIGSYSKTVATPSDHPEGWVAISEHDENMTITYRWQRYNEGNDFFCEAADQIDPGLTR
eukprot:7824986-Pyramimonas_sp.AAC.1